MREEVVFLLTFDALKYKINYFLSRFPWPLSLNPFAKGLLSILSCVIFLKS